MNKNLIFITFVACILFLFAGTTLEAGSPYPITYGEAAAGPAVYAYFENIGGWYNVYTTYWVDLDYTSSNRPDLYYYPDNTRYLAWCVEAQWAGQNIAGNLVLNFSSTDLKQADWLINHFAGSIHQSDQNAALQIAIWEAAIDGTHNLSAGNFRYATAGDYLTQANTYLAALGAISDWSSYTPLNGWVTDGSPVTNDYYQDYLIKPIHPIPEPSAVLLLGSGLLSIGFIARIRRKRS